MLGLSGAAFAANGAPAPSFFNSVEVRSMNFKPFKKWNGMLRRYAKETAEQERDGCKSSRFTECNYDKWMEFLQSVSEKDRLPQLISVNYHMNKSRYITDIVNWGKRDYWATPNEFFAKSGDCEDYAIAKFMSLRKLGFREDQLRVVAVKDMNLKTGHAVLVVFLDDKTYLLDNQIKNVVESHRVRHYKPVFSISTDYWWRHRPAPPS